MTRGKETRLNPKQRKFAHEYVVDLNGTRAAIRAGYSPKTAAAQAWDLLRNPKVAALVAELSEHKLKELGVTSFGVLRELAAIARLDPAEAFDDNGQLLGIKAMPEQVRRSLASIEMETNDKGCRVTKVRFWNKNEAARDLGKHLALFVDRIRHGAEESLEALILASMGKPKVDR